MQPRLLKAVGEVGDFEVLFREGREAGLRIGWLQLAGEIAALPDLDAATAAGAKRAVAAGEDRVISAKRLKGPPVLRDLVREHFTGCRLVLVQGVVEAPEIERDADGWRVRWAGGVERSLSTRNLLAELRKPGFP